MAIFVRGLILAVTVASLAACSTARYKTEPVVRTGTVRVATLRQMETLNMDRRSAAPLQKAALDWYAQWRSPADSCTGPLHKK